MYSEQVCLIQSFREENGGLEAQPIAVTRGRRNRHLSSICQAGRALAFQMLS